MPKYMRNKKSKLDDTTLERTQTKYYNINEVSALYCFIFWTFNANENI